MTRIVYLGFPTGAVAGGQKMILRHVETLRELGFDAVFRHEKSNVMPAWLRHRAPVEVGTPLRRDDILVLPSDAPQAIATVAKTLPQRALVFCQNQFDFASLSLAAVEAFAPERFPTFIVPARIVEHSIRRIFPQAQVELVQAFADERVFRPEAARSPAIVLAPRKRLLEGRAIRNLFPRLHPRHAHIPWIELSNALEAQVAHAMGSSTLFLSLSRLEALGMTPLEAMASGCVCAGFTGIGGREYATAQNGFWVEEDDCEAAADALAQAADLVAGGGAALEAHLAASRATAEAWSHGVFRDQLEDLWTRLAPEARRSQGPLD